MEKFIDIEGKINNNIDLLNIAKEYCEFNIDKSQVTSSLITLIEIILQNQKNIVADFDEVMFS